MICESYIANRLGLLHEANFDKVVTLIKEFFGDNRITIPVDAILKKLKSDKKNKGNGINFSLITSIGNCTFDNIVEDYDIIKDSLIYFNTL